MTLYTHVETVSYIHNVPRPFNFSLKINIKRGLVITIGRLGVMQSTDYLLNNTVSSAPSNIRSNIHVHYIGVGTMGAPGCPPPMFSDSYIRS